MRWDNYGHFGGDGDVGGIEIWRHDKRARLIGRRHYWGGGDVLVGPWKIPTGRWVWLEVHQRLSNTRGLSEVYMDGRLIGRSRAPNTYGRPIDRVRYGLVAVASDNQPSAVTLFFDRASVSKSALGPLRRG
jgi:hypothetical protein